MKKINYLLLFLLSSIFFTACEKDEIKEEETAFSNGIFIVNEGNFGQGNSSLSFLNDDVSIVENNVFSTANNSKLGDQAQSIGFSGDNAYIVVTGSQKIEVVNSETMERKETISSGLINPRYFEPINSSTALVTCWGDTSDESDDYIAVLNTEENKVTNKISVVLGPEKMIKNDDYLFIAHLGAWGTNNKISVYDLTLKDITNTIEVAERPNSMVIKDNYLWVLCAGKVEYDLTTYEITNETPGKLYKINITNNFNITKVYNFETSQHPNFLSLDNDNLFYHLNGSVYKMNVNDENLPSSSFFTCFTPYNMEAYNGNLYLTDAKDFTKEGEVVVYSCNDGKEKNRKTVGIIPGDIGFNLK